MTCLNKMRALRSNYITQAFTLWKVFKSIEPEITDIHREQLILSDESLKESDRTIGDDTLAEMRQTALENNEIATAYNSSTVSAEKPMAYINVFKFIEEYFNKKFETDEADLAEGKKPRAMTSFMMEHLNQQFGLKKLALKQLGQIMQSLNSLHKEK